MSNSTIEILNWAIDTIRERVMFGRDELDASRARESRAKGAMIDAVEEIERLTESLDYAIWALKEFKNHGTRHDTTPTGMFKPCGCFDSFDGDNWQSYIRSQDHSVKEMADHYLNTIEKMSGVKE